VPLGSVGVGGRIALESRRRDPLYGAGLGQGFSTKPASGPFDWLEDSSGRTLLRPSASSKSSAKHDTCRPSPSRHPVMPRVQLLRPHLGTAKCQYSRAADSAELNNLCAYVPSRMAVHFTRRVGDRRSCERRETSAVLTFRSRPPSPRLA